MRHQRRRARSSSKGERKMKRSDMKDDRNAWVSECILSPSEITISPPGAAADSQETTERS